MSGQFARFFTLILFAVILLFTSAGAQEFGVPIELDRTVHFLDASGQLVKVEAGEFLLEQDGLNLRLWPTSGGESLLLKTTILSHDKTVGGPVALSIPGKGAYPDIHMVALLLPAGEGLRALGNYSGVMPRWGLGDLIDAAEDIGDDIADVAEDVVDVVDDAADDVVDAGEWVVDQVEDAASEAMDLAVNTFEEVGPEALEMMDEAGDLYQQAQDLAYEAATNPNLAEDLLNQAAELAQQAAAVTAQAMEDSWDAAVEAANWLYDMADQYLKEIICKAMVYTLQGMDILAELSGPAAEAISAALAPVNQAVEEVVNEAVERVGAEDAMNEIKIRVQEGMMDVVPQFAVIVGMMDDIQYTREQLNQLRGLVFSPSVCELSSDELDLQMQNILNPLYAKMVNLTTQVESSWEAQQPVADTVDVGEEEEVVVVDQPTTASFALETVSVSSHPPIPPGLKATFRNPEGTASSTTCQVVKSGGLTCWAYSYLDNRTAFGIVAYDKDGNVVEQWEKRGARYLSRIVLNPDAQIIEFIGQADRTATMNWDEISAVQPPDVPDPPEFVELQDRPADDGEIVPPAPPEELGDDPAEVEDVPVEPVVVQDKPVKDSDIVPPAPPEELGDDPAEEVVSPVAPVTAINTSMPNEETKKLKTGWKRSFKTRRRGDEGNLDQDWTPRTREGQDVRAGVTLAQTFTTGKKGLLSSIALRVNRRAWSNSNVNIDIRRVLDTGSPSSSTTSALFSTSLAPRNFPIAFSETMTEIDVRAAGIFVEPGELLAITVTNQGIGNYTWWSQGGYEEGQGLVYENREWVDIGSDLVFQTEIDINAPMIVTRGADNQVVHHADEKVTFYPRTDLGDAAKGRKTNMEFESAVSGMIGYRDVFLGPSREILGVTVYPRTGENASSLRNISIEVFKNKESWEKGTEPMFDSAGIVDIAPSSKGVVTFDLRGQDKEGKNLHGSFVRVKSSNIGDLENVKVWSTKDWVSGYAGIQISGSGFLMFLHPSLKPFAVSLGFGTSLPCCAPQTGFGGGVTTGDPSFEIAGQIGISKRPELQKHALVVSAELEIVWSFLPSELPGITVTSSEGVEQTLFEAGSESNIGTLKNAAVHIDIILDPEVLWEVIKSPPLLTDSGICQWYKDIVLGFVLTIGPEWEGDHISSDSSLGGDLSFSYVHAWPGFFGL